MNMDKGKNEVDQSFVLFKQSLKEQNMFKQMDQGDNMNRLMRGRSAYKHMLVEKLLEKGTRA